MAESKTMELTVKKVKFKWLMFGLLLGLSFFMAGIIIVLLGTDNASAAVFNVNPLLWVLAIVPIILGVIFFKIGVNIEKQAKEKKELVNKNTAMSDSWLKQTEMLNMELTMATGQIQEYAIQLEKIADNIATPICLIDKDYKIEQGFNSAFSVVFGKKDFLHISILEAIFHEQSSDVIKELVEFIELSFSNSTASDEMINSANPVSEWNYIFKEAGVLVEKSIKTKIIRVFGSDGKIEKLMFIFKDITFEKQLQAEIDKEKEEFEFELQLITVMFQTDKAIIVSFINEFNKRLEEVKSLIANLKQNEKDDKSVNLLLRHVHTVKGETFSIGFKKIAELSTDFEILLKDILSREISLEDNLTLMSYLEKLTILAEKLNEISRKLFNFSEDTNQLSHNTVQISAEHFTLFKAHIKNILDNFKVGNLDIGDLLELQDNMSKLDWKELSILHKQLEMINEKTSLEQNKKTKLNFIYEDSHFPADKYAIVKEMLLHLIRNSIAHGIEIPEKRSQNKKNEMGKINIHLYQEDKNYVLMYSDDGTGLDVEKIKAKAIEKKIATIEELAAMDNDEILYLIFEDGLSTSEQTDEVSGVGAGMSIVRNNVNNFLKGRLRLTNDKGKGIRIKMIFSV